MKTRFFISQLIIFLALCGRSQTFQRAYGGTGSETGSCIQHTADGNYIIAGWTSSFTNGFNDACLLKVDPQGNLLWSKSYGTTNNEICRYVHTCVDGGFILTGSTKSFGSAGNDLFLIKTDADGNQQWAVAVGGANDDNGTYVVQTSDGGFLATGSTKSFSAGSYDGYLVKITSAGVIQWTKVLGGTGTEALYGLSKTSDGGYIATGEISTNSFGSTDIWLLKLDANGDTLWTKLYGKPTEDAGYAVIQAADGGYLITGDSHIYPTSSAHRAAVLKTDSQGNLLWARAFGSTPGSEVAYNILPDSGNGFYVLGNSSLYGGGGLDMLLIHADSAGNSLWAKTYGGVSIDDAYSFQRTADGGLMLVAGTNSFGAGPAGQYDVYLVRTDSSGASTCFETNPVPGDTVFTLQSRSGTVIISGGTATTLTTVVTNGTPQTNDPCLVSASENEILPEKVLIYPNPFCTTLEIQISDHISSVNGFGFRMYNVYGEEVVRLPIPGHRLFVTPGNIPPGIYIYKITGASGEGTGECEIIATGKIMKQ